MATYYRCESCDAKHSSNPTECRSCGHHVFRQYDPDLRDRILVGLNPLR
jgi:rRNA maturation endonuclease Nob1